MTSHEEVLGRISQEICGVELSVTAVRIRKVLGELLPKLPPAQRLLAALEQDPGQLVSGDASMPAALARIIRVLISEGATALRLPRCAGCDEPKELRAREGTTRICDSCDKRRRRTDAQCCICSQRRRRHANVAGKDYCGACWADKTLGAEAFLRAELRNHLPMLTEAQAAEAIAGVRGSSPGWQLRLALECRAYGAQWFADPAKGPRHFLSLYESLRHVGAALLPPACGHCSRESSLPSVLAGLLCCRRCYALGQKKTCDGCGRERLIARRQPDGTRLCQACAKSLPDKSGVCCVCARLRPVAWKGPDGPVCSICRPRQKIDTCQSCKREKPCLFAGTAKARCHECSKPREQCSICGKSRRVSTRTGAGEAICQNCGRQRETCTDCGRIRTVIGRIDGSPFCEYCYGRNPGSFRDCTRCGRHKKLRPGGLCDRCTADDYIAGLFRPGLLKSSPEAANLYSALLAAEETSILLAFQRNRSTRLLQILLSSPDRLSHAALDAAGTDQATRTVRSMLVQHGLLPQRDNNLARLEGWIASTAAKIPDAVERGAFIRFARWRHLRELRRRENPTSTSLAVSRRRELRMIIDLLGWARQHGRTLADLSQTDIDRFRAAGPGDRHRVKVFLEWTHRNRLSGTFDITRGPQTGLTVTGLSTTERLQRLNRIIAPEFPASPGVRLSAALILLFGIRPHQITGLRLADVIQRGGNTYLRFGPEPLQLPEDVAALTSAVYAERSAPRMLTTVEDTEWLLPGSVPGYPLSVAALARRLRAIGVHPKLTRTGAMASLAQDLPPIILARLTGLSTTNAIRWTQAVAASNARYASAIAERRHGE